MNLIKLFNVPYLKQNIKKSKGFILLFLILVPLFTALFTILEINTVDTVNVVDKVDISIVNILGMYVIPLVLSFTLFGYVFKRNSVDFINSMPLNRKTIFVTNTIGGILLITLMQFLTAMILVICDAFLPDLVIFTAMISDIFILMWVSYVFVFFATNLAMTLSGTFLTQIALTMLILFLVPFCMDGYNGFYPRETYNFVGENIDFTNRVYEKEVNYTMPYRMIYMLFEGSSGDLYSTNSIVRMVVLGAIYFGVGIYLFQKRKMENTEESFSSVKIHIFVKALTILPMIILLNLVEPDIEFVIFAIALICVYYFIFDFVVKRKVKFKISIVSLLVTLIVIEGICLGAGAIKDNLPTEKIDREDVEAVSIGIYRSYSGGSWYYYRDMFSEIEYYFDNEELIDLIFKSANYVEDMYSTDDEKTTTSDASVQEVIMESVTTEVVTQSVIDKKDYEKTASMEVIFKMKSGKKLVSNIEILESDFNKMIEMFEKDEKFVDIVKERLATKGEMTIENILCDNDTKEFIKTEIKSKLEEMTVKDFYQTLRNAQNCGIYQYYYENHLLVSNSFSVTITDEVFKLATKILNQRSVEILKESVKEDTYNYLYVEVPEEINDKYGYMDFGGDEMIDFIFEEAKKEFDITKEYYIIKGTVGPNRTAINFYTNNIKYIENLFEDRLNYFVK